MTKQELSNALTLARDSSRTFLNEDTDQFLGYGLPDFQPCHCTLEQLAALVRWQCIRLNGTVDQEELNEIAEMGRHRFKVV